MSIAKSHEHSPWHHPDPQLPDGHAVVGHAVQSGAMCPPQLTDTNELRLQEFCNLAGQPGETVVVGAPVVGAVHSTVAPLSTLISPPKPSDTHSTHDLTSDGQSALPTLPNPMLGATPHHTTVTHSHHQSPQQSHNHRIPAQLATLNPLPGPSPPSRKDIVHSSSDTQVDCSK